MDRCFRCEQPLEKVKLSQLQKGTIPSFTLQHRMKYSDDMTCEQSY